MRRYRKMIVTFFLPAAALLGGMSLLSSCAHHAATPAEGVVPVSPEVTVPAPMASAPALNDPTDGEKLTDAKIIAVTHAADASEVEQAKLAMRRATDPRVRAYAEQLLRDHETADQRGVRLAEAGNLQPTSSATSDKVTRQAAKTYEELAVKQGADLDRAYVTAQVDEHSAVLRLFDERLIPQATDVNVKSELQHVRPVIAKQLEQALMLQTKLKE